MGSDRREVNDDQPPMRRPPVASRDSCARSRRHNLRSHTNRGSPEDACADSESFCCSLSPFRRSRPRQNGGRRGPGPRARPRARPHGFAISETQFQVLILNASRRLFSDRFFTSSFRPEFYGALGVQWVKRNGPGPEQWERGKPNGHRVPVSPLKRVLMRTIPELQGELQFVVNAFDPWARDRGQYYSLDWKARQDAKNDPAFQTSKPKE